MGVPVLLTVKLAPSLPIPEVVTKAWPAALIIVTDCALLCDKFSEVPFITVDAPENDTLPKLSIGITVLPLLGASCIHSAEEWDEVYV